MTSQAARRPTRDPVAEAEAAWAESFRQQAGAPRPVENRSGIAIKPLYTPSDWSGEAYLDTLGFPGESPMTRGIYPSMHRGRPWSQRQLVGLGLAEQFNERQRELVANGASALSLCPCNSVYRGYDMDEVDSVLLGTCGVVVNSADHMDTALAGVPLERMSVALNDPSPFTLSAFMLAVARRRGVPFTAVSGTSNQSDYLSHFIANHMFFRLSLAGARRVLLDHIAFMNAHVPQWNALSIVGQHMQQAGATPAQAMGLTLSSAIQYASDCVARGMDIDRILPRFSFFFDISISFFEEIAKFRAGRRIWARLTRERLGAKDPRSWRFKFHGQTSGVDLTRQEPLNNIVRVAVQAMSGVLGGLQSMHTDAYDEVLSSPAADAARIAVATQNILRDEAHLADVIDPLGGSYYIERLTDQMEAEIEATIRTIDAAGGMYQAAETGLVQQMIGESARVWQEKVENGTEKIVRVNAYQSDVEAPVPPGLERPDPKLIDAGLARFAQFKAERSQDAVRRALDALARSAHDARDNVYARVVEAAEAGVTHGEICGCLRRELGFGQPLVVA
jgi:methylmalonyl-CoA mutase N-terminal domain/subunit